MLRTTVRFDPATKAVQIESPKDVEINGFALTYLTNGRISISWSNYVSKQNASVVKAVSAYKKILNEHPATYERSLQKNEPESKRLQGGLFSHVDVHLKNKVRSSYEAVSAWNQRP